MTDDEKTQRFEFFILDLREVCKAHKVQLSPTRYDGLEVWELFDGEDELHFPFIDNRIGIDEQGRSTK